MKVWLRRAAMGQECDEIIVCTGVNLKDSGIQYW